MPQKFLIFKIKRARLPKVRANAGIVNGRILGSWIDMNAFISNSKIYLFYRTKRILMNTDLNPVSSFNSVVVDFNNSR